MGVICLLHSSAALLPLNKGSGGPRADLTFFGEEKTLFTLQVTRPRFMNLGVVSPCIFIHSNELIPTRCSN